MADTIDNTESPVRQLGWYEARDDYRRSIRESADHWRCSVQPLLAQFNKRWPSWPFVSPADRAAAQAWREASGLNALEDASEHLSERVSRLHTAVLTIPSPDIDALREKLLMLLDTSDVGAIEPWCDALVEPVRADCERMLREAV